MNNNYSQCEKCGSRFINYENQLIPIHYSGFGTFCLILLLFVPIVNIFILVHLITRKHVNNQTMLSVLTADIRKILHNSAVRSIKKKAEKLY